MSNKGNTPDNAGCECVFGRFKNECFYNHDFKGYHLEKFMDYLNKYIYWYNNERIKLNLRGGRGNESCTIQVISFIKKMVQDLSIPILSYSQSK